MAKKTPKTVDRSWFDEIEVPLSENVKLDFATALDRAMQQFSISKSELARLINSSPAWITKVMRGDANLTIETMSQLAEAIDHEIHIHLAPKTAAFRWVEVFSSNVTGAKESNRASNTNWIDIVKENKGVRYAAAA